MNQREKAHIAHLIGHFAAKDSTETLLILIAETGGMLDACHQLLRQTAAADPGIRAWLGKQCKNAKVREAYFLTEITTILAVLQPGEEEEHAKLYGVLGLAPGSGRDEIKRRYRRLCLSHHPDTATDGDRSPETFIRITRAYHALLHGDTSRQQGLPLSPLAERRAWRGHAFRPSGAVLRAYKQRQMVWLVCFSLTLILISIVIGRIYDKHVMLHRLQSKGVAFVPPAQRTGKNSVKGGPVALTINEDSTVRPVARQNQPRLPSAAVIPQQPAHLPLSDQVEDLQQERPAQADKAASPVGAAPASDTPVHERIPVVQSEPLVPRVALNPEHDSLAANMPPSEASLAVVSPAHPSGAVPPDPILIPSPKNKKKILQKNEPPHSAYPKTMQQPPRVAVAAQRPAPPITQLPPRQRIDTFLRNYVTAYQQQNLPAFSRFFAANATENGKAFTEVLPSYVALFAAVETLRFTVSPLRWEQKQGQLHIVGRFLVDMQFHDGNQRRGQGPIDFLLTDTTAPRVQSLEYSFDP